MRWEEGIGGEETSEYEALRIGEEKYDVSMRHGV
jgi:hypothetical protein